MFKRRNMTMISVLLALAIAAPIIASETGSAKFAVVRPLFVAGTEVQIGQYDVSWESSDKDVAVKFSAVGKPLVIKVQGKIEEVAKKSDYNSLVIGKDAAGREAIKQLQFGGKNIRIVFE